MDNLLYYIMLQNNSVQPIIVKQPSAIIIHTQPKHPITLDLPPQNIILKNDEPRPIIVRQQNPNVIIQKSQNEFYDNNNISIGDYNKFNGLNLNSINTNSIMEYGINQNKNNLDTIKLNDHIDSPYLYNNSQNFDYENKTIPINNIHYNNIPLNNDNNYSPYNNFQYSNNHTG
ncbi:conserved Plasmodium protein, unknown function [Plasmodium berghei]|uniref:Uncharacterized protein n=2 Tax=Plasmodium berghei TaxID=5821 RepID=A0A509AWC7_PLABA|nr:conserved Plasmodium protein, unknown function [Plasmodium berghei ANKA]CXI92426.1 conserved Plasmodium protein, unknown function [Plasmodium berghei]SCL96620.1 conserved Plasmodium protein, unknown function [Plasmodium berghei]SCM16460.1 conserved Plasmodium protein, unknown function [Plasmodium berghei]SCM18254.1 conserved Plasmodium protein, unknown function [Plasmodium berghei]SCN27682.1 conserved Plasmodium protein, unknown function [Plasmodium berghei]|eukprot:XP_034423337.1 conserved Plasmodium protein, unknown function [Plasmodium berghei ANKA]